MTDDQWVRDTEQVKESQKKIVANGRHQTDEAFLHASSQDKRSGEDLRRALIKMEPLSVRFRRLSRDIPLPIILKSRWY